MDKRDYYQVLGVGKTAPQKEIRQAFRKLARKHHPDVNPGDKSAEAKFKEINEAHQVLSDPNSRAKYDQYGEDWKYADKVAGAGVPRNGSSRAQSWNPRPGTSRAESAGPGASERFGDLFGRFGGRDGQGFSVPGQDLEYVIEITLEEAFQGTIRTIQLSDQRGASKRLEVKIPAGVHTGSRIRIAGEGDSGVGGGPKGDLWLTVTVTPHGSFEREGDNVRVEVPVQLLDAILGGEIGVPTLKGGTLALKIPPGTQNGQVFRLRSQGMPALNGGVRGDLYAKVTVVLPTNLTPDEKKAFEQIKALRDKYQAAAAA